MDSPVQQPRRLSLDAPGNQSPPSNSINFIPQTILRNLPNNQFGITVTSAKYVAVYNRTGHTILIELGADLGGNALSFILERGERVAYTITDFNVFSVTVTDITFNQTYNGLGREEKSIGRRHGSNFPYVNNNGISAPGGITANGGVLVITSSSPIIQTSASGDVSPAINFSPSFTASGAGSQTLLSQSAVLSGTIILACGYFIGCHVFNPSGSVGNITVQFITPDNTVNGPTVNYPPGFGGYVPIECDQLVVTATAVNQFVAGYQPVMFYPTNL